MAQAGQGGLGSRFTRKTVNDWAGFMGLVEPKLEGGWLFRGVSRASYTLVPSIGRVHRDPPVDLAAERQLLEKFKREVRPYLSFQPADDWDWLAIAQHHGVPTRLIDWSETPLVAAFFAVWGDDGQDAGVFVVRRPPPPTANMKDGPFTARGVHFLYPSHVTRRITAQRGLFTVHPEPAKVYAPASMIQVVIPWQKKDDFRVKLDGLGINYGSIYPDVDGLSRHLAWVFRERPPSTAKRLTTATRAEPKPSAERTTFDPDDPQKGAWGGEATANGWAIQGAVKQVDDGWYRVDLAVKSTRRGRPLRKPVVFHLHDTFPEPRQRVSPKAGVARLHFNAYGAFTVGALVTQDDTRLELDLSRVQKAPTGFRRA